MQMYAKCAPKTHETPRSISKLLELTSSILARRRAQWTVCVHSPSLSYPPGSLTRRCSCEPAGQKLILGDFSRTHPWAVSQVRFKRARQLQTMPPRSRCGFGARSSGSPCTKRQPQASISIACVPSILIGRSSDFDDLKY